MNDSLDDQLAEYQDIKAWLAGKKQPAQGRTWRRRLQVQIQQALPKPVRGVAYAVAPMAGAAFLRITIGLGLANLGLPLMEAVLGGGLGATSGVEAMLAPMLLIVNITGVLAALGVCLSLLVAGE